jgi:acyl-CoA reductase-like NAD-dependent aldehyde dehydrogenase
MTVPRHEDHFIGGRWVPSSRRFEVVDPYRERVLALVAGGDAATVEAAVEAAVRAGEAPLPTHRRAALLEAIAGAIAADAEGFAAEICAETAKPITTARAEVARALETFRFAAAAARTFAGEGVALDATPAGEGKLAFTLREPRGVVAAITPFNFPLNLVAHKVAPALAAGCPVVLKPAEKAPLTASRLVRAMADVGVPPGWVNLVHGTGPEVVGPLVTHDDVAVVSFTGSTAVGHAIAAQAVGKKLILELGSAAPAIVMADADLGLAVARVRATGFTHAGQSCIAVQRVIVERPVYDAFVDALAEAVHSLVVGDPADEATDVGPLIRPSERERVLAWIAEAVDQGARVVAGGRVSGGLLEPTVVADARPDMRICRDEVFGPVVAVVPVDDLDEALAAANATPGMLNAAVFTRSVHNALRAVRALRAGTVLVNESPTFRADQMPYGGRGLSGEGREGPLWAMREYTVEKLVVL